MKKNLILALDQGTTGSSALLFDFEKKEVLAFTNQEFPQIYPKPGHVEHDPEEVWKSQVIAVEKVLKGFDPKEIACIGITNQRETIVPVSKSGEILGNALVWQDKRTTDFCLENRDQFKEKFFDRLGMPLDPYFSAPKIKWLLENSSSVEDHIKNDDALFLTIDSFLLAKLTQFKSIATEPSNASRTLLVNLQTGKYDQDLLNFFGVRESSLAPIKDSFGEFGITQGLDFLPDGIPITGILGDQQAALFGQGGTEVGDLKCTYGTGAFALVNTGEEFKLSSHGLLTDIAFQYEGKRCYAFEGSSFIAGAAIQWLRDELKIIESSPESEELAKQVTDLAKMEHILFYPYFSGIGVPHWKPDVRAAIVGLTRDTGRPEIARACLEGVALSVDELLLSLEKDAGIAIDEVFVDGGMVKNSLFVQMQSNFSQKKITLPKVLETTALGATLAAAIGNQMARVENIKEFSSRHKSFETEESDENYFQTKKRLWKQVLSRSIL